MSLAKNLSCSSVVLSVVVSRSWTWSFQKAVFPFYLFIFFFSCRSNYLHLIKSSHFTVLRFKVGQALSSLSQDYFLFKLSHMLWTAQTIHTGHPHLQVQPEPPASEGCPNGHAAPSPWAPPERGSPQSSRLLSFTRMDKFAWEFLLLALAL